MWFLWSNYDEIFMVGSLFYAWTMVQILYYWIMYNLDIDKA